MASLLTGDFWFDLCAEVERRRRRSFTREQIQEFDQLWASLARQHFADVARLEPDATRDSYDVKNRVGGATRFLQE